MSNNNRGFSLLEVMISLAIAGGLLITLIYTLNHHLAVAERQRILMDCTILAKQKLYEMEKSPAPTRGNFDKPYSEFFYETAVTDSSFPSMLEIKVTVSKDKERVVLSRLVIKPIKQ